MTPARPVSRYDTLPPLALFAGVLLVFVRFGQAHQAITYLIGHDFFLLYLAGIPAIFGLIVTGGFQRTFRGRPTIFWMLFVFWLVIALPFSEWRGGSFNSLKSYVRSELLMLFVIGGLTVTWSHCRRMLYALALGTMFSVITSRLFQSDFHGRAGLQFGTVANPNDISAHFILGVPIVIWAGLSSKSRVFRLIAIATAIYGVYQILASGSRGAMIGVAAAIVCFLLLAPGRQRLVLAVAVIVGAVTLPAMVPSFAFTRIRSLWATDAETLSTDAAESSAARRYLFQTAARYAIEHPVFGVGLGQFPNYEGTHERSYRGLRGGFGDVHNSYLAVAAECGFPAFLFYIAGTLSAVRLFLRTHRAARQRRDCHDIRLAALYILVGFTGFLAAIAFLNFSYFYYLPAMSGLAIAVSSSAEREFEARTAASGSEAQRAAANASFARPGIGLDRGGSWPVASRRSTRA